MVRQIDVAGGVNHHAGRPVEACHAAGAIGVARIPRRARQGAHLPVGGDLADSVVVTVRQIDIATGIQRNTPRLGELCGTATPIRAAIVHRTSGIGCHYSGLRHLAYRVVVDVRDIEISTAVHRYPFRGGKTRTSARAVEIEFKRVRLPRQSGYHALRRHLADHTPIRHIDIAAGVHGQLVRGTEQRHLAGAIGVTGLPGGATRQGCHRARRTDLADRFVAVIRHIDVSVEVHGHSLRLVEPGGATGGIRVTGLPRAARQCGYHTHRCHLADRAINDIRHIDITAGIHGHRIGTVKPGIAADIVRAAVLSGAARQSAYHPGRGDLADRAIAGIRHIDAASGIHGYSRREPEPRRPASAVGAARESRTSGQGTHHPDRGDLADRVTVGVGHIDVAVGVHGRILGLVEAGGGARTIDTTLGAAGAGEDALLPGGPHGAAWGGEHGCRKQCLKGSEDGFHK